MPDNETFTHKAFCSLKVNAVHSMYNCVRDILCVLYVRQVFIVIFSESGLRVLDGKLVPFQENPHPFPAAHNLLHFSMSSPYSSRWRRTMFSTKLERLLPLSPNLRTMKSARSCVSLFRETAFRLLNLVGTR